MPEDPEPGPFSYSFRTPLKREGPTEPTPAETQILFSIRDTLTLLTGGCDIIQRTEGVFCAKHDRPVISGESKCDYLASRFAKNVGEEASKGQLQQYVNEVLGIRDPKLGRRLTGYATRD
jgi:hypothetical protein